MRLRHFRPIRSYSGCYYVEQVCATIGNKRLRLDANEAWDTLTSRRMLNLQRQLFGRGIYTYYSTYLGAGSEGMIRCAVFRDHSRTDIDTLISVRRRRRRRSSTTSYWRTASNRCW